MNQVPAGVGDLAMSLGESRPCSLAAVGPRCGSGQGFICRLERLLRVLQCFHPLETLDGKAIRVSGDGQGDDPSINSDGNRVTSGSTALSLVQFGGNSG